KSTFKTGKRYILTGEVSRYFVEKNMLHPDFELLGEQEEDLLHFRRIVPVYSETEGLHQKSIRRFMMEVVENYASNLMSPIPEDICRRRRLMEITRAVRDVHFPPQEEDIRLLSEMRSEAHRRLIYDEFFFFQLGMALKKKGTVLHPGFAFKTGGPLLKRFYEILSFPLTGAQKRVIAEIEDDMAQGWPMNRLLQGDVGSGKTVVSMAAMVTACDNGYQSAIMVPTEILAEQHCRSIRAWAEKLGLRVVLLTGSLGAAEKRSLLEEVRTGAARIVVGTHALISQDTEFSNLGLVVIDEQHRFGVVQRASVRAKGVNPDVLVMTATPIPRTLAMTVYGDLDVSVIDELPPGRTPVTTKLIADRRRGEVVARIRDAVAEGRQVYWVCPLIEESEALDLENAVATYERLGEELAGMRVGLVHGRLPGEEKARVMAAFKQGEIDVLVATTVIEVGVDVSNASLMVIEHAERFGLSQLHQLRGRVGRGTSRSTCVLLYRHPAGPLARERLTTMYETSDGFEIARRDLKLRGPGEFLGARQSGAMLLRFADLDRDADLVAPAITAAQAMLRDHPAEAAAHLLRWLGSREDFLKA
ncbi:MAG: ATP-dependent DNA helicase RecG, partial [Burkholderiaceae bacterium]|nr:ATP-dependent DNA helicase RecG [Burkholderiaceae bacterium]